MLDKIKKEHNATSDSTGTVFTMEKVRTFPDSERLGKNLQGNCELKVEPRRSKHECKKWAVLTTINEASEAVRRFLYR